jgi:hypothetical protein
VLPVFCNTECVPVAPLFFKAVQVAEATVWNAETAEFKANTSALLRSPNDV